MEKCDVVKGNRFGALIACVYGKKVLSLTYILCIYKLAAVNTGKNHIENVSHLLLNGARKMIRIVIQHNYF